jgi:hypothetical protein
MRWVAIVMTAPANCGVQCHDCVARVVKKPPKATIVAAHHFRVGHIDVRVATTRAARALIAHLPPQLVILTNN